MEPGVMTLHATLKSRHPTVFYLGHSKVDRARGLEAPTTQRAGMDLVPQSTPPPDGPTVYRPRLHSEVDRALDLEAPRLGRATGMDLVTQWAWPST